MSGAAGSSQWMYATGYEVGQSLRFDNARGSGADSPFLSRTFVTPTNRKKFTFSVWLKRSVFGAYPRIFSTATGAGGNTDNINFMNDDTLRFISDFGQLTTTQVFRDISAWYHIVVAYDSTQGTAANRVKFFINGTQVTSFGTTNYPDQNDEIDFNGNINHTLRPSSAVMTILQSASKILSFRDSGEKPPNTTECTAPILVQASIAKDASIIIGI
mgnify:CR=1 FL=1